MGDRINTINGPIALDALGKTLMHEHLTIGLPGWESDTLADHRHRRDMVARCVDLIQELQDNGFNSLLDPCPNDIGRDVDLMGEVASRTGFNILFATGLYDELMGGSYWKIKAARDPDAENYIADMYIREIEKGIGDAGSKPAIIKVATGRAPFSHFETIAIQAAATAAVATGTPITTHTAGIDGDRQLQLLSGRGVPAHRIIIGHCCGSNDRQYHQDICRHGAYIGFDRFGLLQFNSDENRVANLSALMKSGYAPSVIISHDCTFNLRGPLVGRDDIPPVVRPMHFVREIAPRLRESGIEAPVIEALLTANPRRYFKGEEPPPPAIEPFASSQLSNGFTVPKSGLRE